MKLISEQLDSFGEFTQYDIEVVGIEPAGVEPPSAILVPMTMATVSLEVAALPAHRWLDTEPSGDLRGFQMRVAESQPRVGPSRCLRTRVKRSHESQR